MATRGRPRVHPEGTTAKDLKREWDKRMRNAHGEEPSQPQRKPVVIYLSDEARETISDERKTATGAGIPPVLTSQLIEDLLRDHARDPLRRNRAGISEVSLRRQIAKLETERDEARERLQLLQYHLQEIMAEPARARVADRTAEAETMRKLFKLPDPRYIRTLVKERTQAKNSRQPTRPITRGNTAPEDMRKFLAEAVANGAPGEVSKFLDRLAELFKDRRGEDTRETRFKVALEEFLLKLLRSGYRAPPPQLGWKRE